MNDVKDRRFTAGFLHPWFYESSENLPNEISCPHLLFGFLMENDVTWFIVSPSRSRPLLQKTWYSAQILATFSICWSWTGGTTG